MCLGAETKDAQVASHDRATARDHVSLIARVGKQVLAWMPGHRVHGRKAVDLVYRFTCFDQRLNTKGGGGVIVGEVKVFGQAKHHPKIVGSRNHSQ